MGRMGFHAPHFAIFPEKTAAEGVLFCKNRIFLGRNGTRYTLGPNIVW